MPFKNPHPLYGVWQSMRQRCLNPNHPNWKHYGGRGISICPAWDDFHTFVKDMSPSPEGHSIDRIDNDGDYSPENCRWVTQKQQLRNTRRTNRLFINGTEYLAIELAEIAGIKADAIIARYKAGLSYDEIIDPKPRSNFSGLALGGKASGAKKQAMTHCKYGHEFTPENTRITKEGWRNCRACHAAKMRRRNAAKRAGC